MYSSHGIIGKNRKKEGKDSYHIRENNTSDAETLDVNYTKPKERYLIDMIKESMFHEKYHDNELILYLKEQIQFFKSELREQNKVITNLLSKIYVAETSPTLIKMCTESKLNINSPESNGIKSLKNKTLKNKSFKNNDDLINPKDETHGKSKDDVGTEILKMEICGDSH